MSEPSAFVLDMIKDCLFALDPAKCFTEPHSNGFPAALVRLPAVTARELKPIITEAWRCQVATELTTNSPAGTRVRRSVGSAGRKRSR